MSKKNKTIFTCPVCMDKQPLEFIKPTFFKNTVKPTVCGTCECKFEVTLSKTRGGQRACFVDIQVQISEVSAYAKANHNQEGAIEKLIEDMRTGPMYATEVPLPAVIDVDLEKENQQYEPC